MAGSQEEGAGSVPSIHEDQKDEPGSRSNDGVTVREDETAVVATGGEAAGGSAATSGTPGLLVTPGTPPPLTPPMGSVCRRPHILLASSGSVAAIKFPIIARSFSDWADVRAICTQSALRFVDCKAMPMDVPLHLDDEEWLTWTKLGDGVLHIELRRWADILVIAPLSANTLAKIASGLCDNLLTCVVRVWDFRKPLLIAPAMNTFMWDSPFTARHLSVVEDLGVTTIMPIVKKLACGDVGGGAMAEPSDIEAAVRLQLAGLDVNIGSLRDRTNRRI
eukprot:TRINITY_DN17230_c0_g1_i1.p1 TRINITY_DN17230_c0_g1~~TRINITY_DN17230_c0_g1_i1.p1  ORF type:complete len:277 (-),score=51.95 TRINITY_DN17230_c0_g1_i1:44-874(-)